LERLTSTTHSSPGYCPDCARLNLYFTCVYYALCAGRARRHSAAKTNCLARRQLSLLQPPHAACTIIAAAAAWHISSVCASERERDKPTTIECCLCPNSSLVKYKIIKEKLLLALMRCCCCGALTLINIYMCGCLLYVLHIIYCCVCSA
jgi:hypothetical protein